MYTFFLFYIHRIVDKSFKVVRSLITKVYPIVKLITTLKEGPYAQGAINQLQVPALSYLLLIIIISLITNFVNKHYLLSGRCITAMFRKFHPEHFVCAFCLKQLNKGTFKEQNDKPYCHGCFDKLFG